MSPQEFMLYSDPYEQELTADDLRRRLGLGMGNNATVEEAPAAPPHEALLAAIRTSAGPLYFSEVAPSDWDEARSRLRAQPGHDWLAAFRPARDDQPAAVLLISAAAPPGHVGATLDAARAAGRAAELLEGKVRAEIEASRNWTLLLSGIDPQAAAADLAELAP